MDAAAAGMAAAAACFLCINFSGQRRLGDAAAATATSYRRCATYTGSNLQLDLVAVTSSDVVMQRGAAATALPDLQQRDCLMNILH